MIKFKILPIVGLILIGSLVASAILQISDIASYKLPDQSINFCLLILGASVGCRFADKTFNDIAKNALHSFIATFLYAFFISPDEDDLFTPNIS